MDTTIIEHLACLEINNIILQPPFHLLSNIKWNDKGLSFDGDIEVYNNNIQKTDFIGRAPVQIKGTTTYKKQYKTNKIKHSVCRKDLEVYYKDGNGVLYFIVSIHPESYIKQAYYRILAPLDLKGLLDKLESNGNDSVTIPFKKLESDKLEIICKSLIKTVEKQPKHYIEASSKMKFTKYKINYADVTKDSFDFFEEPAYIYGVLEDIEIPVETATMFKLAKRSSEIVTINNEHISVDYEIVETEDRITMIVEKSLTLNIDKKKKTGNIDLSRIRTIGSYLKCLKLVKYQLEHNKLPFKSFKFVSRIHDKQLFGNVDEDIKLYEELFEVCNQIGISENYVFNEDEDIHSLFTGIIDIFKHKKYELLNLGDNKLENATICNIELSDFITVKLMFVDDKFIDSFSVKALTKIGGLIPKTLSKNTHTISLSDNWKDDYWKVSIYSAETIKQMGKLANFNFNTLKLSYTEEYHDIGADATINIILDFVNYFDESSDNRYLEVAFDLVQRYLEKFPESDIAKINLYIIRLKQLNKLFEEEQNDIYDILEESEKEGNKNISFACEVLLQNKLKAKRFFDSLDEDNQNMIKEFPIYRIYENIEKN